MDPLHPHKSISRPKNQREDRAVIIVPESGINAGWKSVAFKIQSFIKNPPQKEIQTQCKTNVLNMTYAKAVTTSKWQSNSSEIATTKGRSSDWSYSTLRRNYMNTDKGMMNSQFRHSRNNKDSDILNILSNHEFGSTERQRRSGCRLDKKAKEFGNWTKQKSKG
ncbi:hypothetical protein T459_18523 [Capsicum annuum]|uniref:Uncharacterized protein n=1 Tax=Capsicum annuum TaxID=4072 RepID=A0A2G2ZEY4_CAPAN|nr:hypothetical protein T459_18523 [Capsicum annuum]